MHTYSNSRNTKKETAIALNRLLRGELAAIDTYDQVIEEQDDLFLALDLLRIRAEHEGAADALTARIEELGGQPSMSSGAWGVLTGSLEDVAQLFGRRAALLMLRKGEERGLSVYEKAIMDPAIDPKCKVLIGADLFPQQHGHIVKLDKLMQETSR